MNKLIDRVLKKTKTNERQQNKMFENLKEFISVVQEGINSNNNLRQTLQEVQKVKNIFKDKQKPLSESKVNFGVGGELLEKYQSDWAEIHQNSEQNARAAAEVDELILELHDISKVRLRSASHFVQNLSNLPNLTASIAQCVESLKTIQNSLQEVENDLIDLEDIFERNKMEKWKLDHHFHLSLYKEKKLAALEDTRHRLAKENAKQSTEREKRQLAELQVKRESSAAAFQSDMARYLSAGTLPSVATPTPKTTLDQIQLDDDQKTLEQFLEN